MRDRICKMNEVLRRRLWAQGWHLHAPLCPTPGMGLHLGKDAVVIAFGRLATDGISMADQGD